MACDVERELPSPSAVVPAAQAPIEPGKGAMSRIDDRWRKLLRRRFGQNATFLFDNAVLLVGWLVAGVSGYLYHLFLGRMLGPAEYGVVAASVALAAILGAPTAMVLAVAAKYAATLPGLAQRHRLFVQLSWSAGLIGLALTLALWLFAAPIGSFLQIPAGVVRVLAPSGLLLLIQPVPKGIAQGERRFLLFSAIHVAEPLLRFLCGVALVAFGLGAAAGVAGIPLGVLGAYLLSLWALRPLLEARGEGAVKVEGLTSYWLASAATLLGLMVLQQMDTLLAMHLFTAENGGLYAAVAIVGKILFFGTGSVAAVMFPMVAARAAAGKGALRLLGACLTIVAAGSLVLAAPFIVAPAFVLRLLYGPAFLAAAPALPVYALGAVALALINVLLNYFLAANQRRHLIPLWAALGVEVVLLDLWRPGIVGMATVTAGVLAGLCLILLVLTLTTTKLTLWRPHNEN